MLSMFIVACKRKPLEFEKLDQFSKIDSMADHSKPIYFKTDVYIVKNYTDESKNERTVDSFAYHNRAKDLNNFSDYNIIMYKHSEATDIANLLKNPKDYETESFLNDMVYVYRWVKGQWVSKTKYKGRETVDSQE